MTEGSHDVVQHKRMDRDGAKLENTGLNPFSYNIRAPFCNTISPGVNETWSNLYPDQLNALLAALSDRSTGDFQHPRLGLRRCKCTSFKETLDPNYRSGVVLEFALLEDTETDDATAITQNSVYSQATNAAFQLDVYMQGQGIVLVGAPPGFTFGSVIAGLLAGLETGLAVLSLIDSVIGLIYQLVDSLADPVLVLQDYPDILIDCLLSIKSSSTFSFKPIQIYQTVGKTSVNQLCKQLKISVADLIALNPQLASGPVVPIFTYVKFYQS